MQTRSTNVIIIVYHTLHYFHIDVINYALLSNQQSNYTDTMWKNSNCPVQFFYNNKLDKDVQRIVQPFNVILSVFLTSKYKIRKSYMTPCNKKYPILLFFTISFLNGLNIHYIFNKYNRGIEHTIFVALDIMYYLSYILLIICNIVHSRSNVFLILQIQDIHRSIDISKSIPSYIRWNWISLFTVFSTIILRAIHLYVIQASMYLVEASRDLLVLQYDLNLVYGIRLTKLLTIYLKEWISNVKNERNEEYYDNFFKTYHNILEAYKLFTKCFRILVRWCFPSYRSKVQVSLILQCFFFLL